MGFLDKLFGKKKSATETAVPAPGSAGSYLDEIQKITDRLEEIQNEMTEENKAQYNAEIKSLMEREIEILEKQFPGKDTHHG